jgi:hypothetical protein
MKQKIEKALKASHDEIVNDIENHPFTNEGFKYFNVEVGEFVETLLGESLRKAKYNQHEKINPDDVENALSNMNKRRHTSRESVVYQILLVIGGASIGAGMSKLYEAEYLFGGLITILSCVLFIYLMRAYNSNLH